jgi:hypothetical protein
MFGFKRQTTLSRINDLIYEHEKALIENQAAADHYQAIADGKRASLKKLRAMRDGDILHRPNVPLNAEPAVPVTKAKLRAAN